MNLRAQRRWRRITSVFLLPLSAGQAQSAEDPGRQLLEARCGRCHAIKADARSRLGNAPNLWDTLRSYPEDRLEFELAEGIGSRHPPMPQIQFTSEEIWSIRNYLADE